MGNKSQKVANFTHRQKNDAKARKLDEKVQRMVAFEINRMGIKARLEAEKTQLAFAALVFFFGVFLVMALLIYFIGPIIYG